MCDHFLIFDISITCAISTSSQSTFPHVWYFYHMCHINIIPVNISSCLIFLSHVPYQHHPSQHSLIFDISITCVISTSSQSTFPHIWYFYHMCHINIIPVNISSCLIFLSHVSYINIIPVNIPSCLIFLSHVPYQHHPSQHSLIFDISITCVISTSSQSTFPHVWYFYHMCHINIIPVNISSCLIFLSHVPYQHHPSQHFLIFDISITCVISTSSQSTFPHVWYFYHMCHINIIPVNISSYLIFLSHCVISTSSQSTFPHIWYFYHMCHINIIPVNISSCLIFLSHVPYQHHPSQHFLIFDISITLCHINIIPVNISSCLIFLSHVSYQHHPSQHFLMFDISITCAISTSSQSTFSHIWYFYHMCHINIIPVNISSCLIFLSHVSYQHHPSQHFLMFDISITCVISTSSQSTFPHIWYFYHIVSYQHHPSQHFLMFDISITCVISTSSQSTFPHVWYFYHMCHINIIPVNISSYLIFLSHVPYQHHPSQHFLMFDISITCVISTSSQSTFPHVWYFYHMCHISTSSQSTFPHVWYFYHMCHINIIPVNISSCLIFLSHVSYQHHPSQHSLMFDISITCVISTSSQSTLTLFSDFKPRPHSNIYLKQRKRLVLKYEPTSFPGLLNDSFAEVRPNR